MRADMEPFLTVKQVARLFQMTEPTIRDWVNRGQLRGFLTPGRTLLFDPADVRAALTPVGVPKGEPASRPRKAAVPDGVKEGLLKHGIVLPGGG